MLSLFFLLVSDVHVVGAMPPQSGDPCISEELAAGFARGLGQVQGIDVVPTLVSPGCNQRIYVLRGKHRVIVFRPFGDRAAPIHAFSDEGEVASTACWEKAQAGIRRLHLPIADQLLSELQRVHPVLFDDLQLGPAHWLSCKDDVAHAQSIDVLLHESSHLLATEKCLFGANDGMSMCFSFARDLPPRSVGRFELPRTDGRGTLALAQVIRTYLIASNAPLLALLNELNAYVIGTRVKVSTAERVGPGIFADGKRAHESYVPVFLLMTARYVSWLRHKAPALFASTFGAASSANVAALNRLVAAAESAYEAWLASLALFELTPATADTATWQMYKKEASLPLR